MLQNGIRRTTLSTGGDTISIDATGGVVEFVYNGSGTMLASTTISPAAIATTGITYKVRIRYNATFTLNGNSITIFSQTLSQEMASGGNTIFDCTYIAGAWTVCVINSSTIEPKAVDGVRKTTLSGAGGTVTLVPNVDYITQELTGTGTLIGNYVYQATGVQNGDKFRVIYNATFAATGNGVTIFGYSLSESEILYGGITVDAEYNGTTWTTTAFQNPFPITIKDTIDKEISFLAAELCLNTYYVPYAFTITQTRAYVTKDIRGDDAQIDIYINNVLVTNGALTIPQDSLLNAAVQNTPTALASGEADSVIEFRTTGCTTTTGRAFCQLIITRT